MPSLSRVLLAALSTAGSCSHQTGAFVVPGTQTSMLGSTGASCSTRQHTATTAVAVAISHRSDMCSSRGFSRNGVYSGRHSSGAAVGTLRMSAATEAPVAAESSESEATAESGVATPGATQDIPTNLPSECGIDYVPLATMLATGDLKGADQFTRDALIKAAGAGSQKRDFVYWTEVKKIPSTDMATMENLWLKYSKGKFGYSVQKDVWRRAKGDFENFCRRVGWTTTDSEVERKLRWFGANEFIYDVDRATVGHLPLTSALRGTQLLKEIFKHPVWETEWKWE